MIVNAILFMIDGILSVVTYPIGSQPDAALPADMTAAIASAGQYYSTANQIFPVDVLLVAFAFLLTIEGFILLFKLFQWSIKKIPGIS